MIFFVYRYLMNDRKMSNFRNQNWLHLRAHCACACARTFKWMCFFHCFINESETEKYYWIWNGIYEHAQWHTVTGMRIILYGICDTCEISSELKYKRGWHDERIRRWWHRKCGAIGSIGKICLNMGDRWTDRQREAGLSDDECSDIDEFIMSHNWNLIHSKSGGQRTQRTIEPLQASCSKL